MSERVSRPIVPFASEALSFTYHILLETSIIKQWVDLDYNTRPIDILLYIYESWQSGYMPTRACTVSLNVKIPSY